MQGARVSKTWQYFSSYSRRHRTAEYRQVCGRTRSCRQGTYPSGFARCFSANQWLENKARVPHRDEIGKFICITLPPASSACPPHRSRAHREHKVILPKTSPCPPSRKARTWAAATKPALWFSLCESAHGEVTPQSPGPARCYRRRLPARLALPGQPFGEPRSRRGGGGRSRTGPAPPRLGEGRGKRGSRAACLPSASLEPARFPAEEQPAAALRPAVPHRILGGSGGGCSSSSSRRRLVQRHAAAPRRSAVGSCCPKEQRAPLGPPRSPGEEEEEEKGGNSAPTAS